MAKFRRVFSRELKLQVVREAEAGTPLAELARQHELHPSMIQKWLQLYRTKGETAFRPGANGEQNPARVSERRIAELERIIGQMTIENTFLKKVLQRLETTLSAKTPGRGGS
jgi:transposase-like protein